MAGDDDDFENMYFRRKQEDVLDQLVKLRLRRTFMKAYILLFFGAIVLMQVFYVYRYSYILSDEYRNLFMTIAPFLSAVVGYVAGHVYNKLGDPENYYISRYRADADLGLIEELSRMNREILILREKLDTEKRK